MTVIDEYWSALDRLIKNKPKIVEYGSAINKDTVALEAGRKRGSIKKSRAVFSKLIAAIDQAAEHSISKVDAVGKVKSSLRNEREKKKNYRDLYHNALNRELMLVERLAVLEKRLSKYDNVVPIV